MASWGFDRNKLSLSLEQIAIIADSTNPTTLSFNADSQWKMMNSSADEGTMGNANGNFDMLMFKIDI
jgi:hypothetical protein